MATFSIPKKYEDLLAVQSNKSKFICQLLEIEYQRQEAEFGVGNFQDCTRRAGANMPSKSDVSTLVMAEIRQAEGKVVSLHHLYQIVQKHFFPDGVPEEMMLQNSSQLEEEKNERLNENDLEKKVRLALNGLKDLSLIESVERGKYRWKGFPVSESE